MKKFTIEIDSTVPTPMPLAERDNYRLPDIPANTYEEALKYYRKQKENQLPKGFSYSLKVTDEKGIEYNPGGNIWDRTKE